jgi:hypothetical protein
VRGSASPIHLLDAVLEQGGGDGGLAGLAPQPCLGELLGLVVADLVRQRRLVGVDRDVDQGRTGVGERFFERTGQVAGLLDVPAEAAAVFPVALAYAVAMNAAASSWCTRTNRTLSSFLRSPSMIPLTPSPGRPNTVSTPHSASREVRTSEAISPRQCLLTGTSGAKRPS